MKKSAEEIRELESLIKTNKIWILAGEGEEGRFKLYSGTRTLRALKMRITKEKVHGDRWARAYVVSGDVMISIFGCETREAYQSK